MVLTLPNSKKWAGVNYPQPFLEDSVAKAFAKLPEFKDTLSNVISGSFFKRTRKRKGVGQERAYRLEPYVQEAGGVYGKLNANTMVVYLLASHQSTLEAPPFQVPSSHTPLFQLPSSEKPPIEMTPWRDMQSTCPLKHDKIFISCKWKKHKLIQLDTYIHLLHHHQQQYWI